jgi:hypothetical protein
MAGATQIGKSLVDQTARRSLRSLTVLLPVTNTGFESGDIAALGPTAAVSFSLFQHCQAAPSTKPTMSTSGTHHARALLAVSADTLKRRDRHLCLFIADATFFSRLPL